MTPRLVTDEDITAAQAGDADAMWRVVSAHDSVIRGVIRRAAPGATAEQAEDLLQEGRAVLITHVRSYDSSQSATQLHTYAHQAMSRVITEEWIRMTTGLTVDPSTIRRVRKALADWEGNREAALLSLHARYGIERGTALAAMEASAPMEWLDAPVTAARSSSTASDGLGCGYSLAESLSDTSADFTEPAERRALAHHLLKQVAPRQSYALAAFHGVGMMSAPDADVAAHLETPAHRVRQLRRDGALSARRYADRNGLAA